MQEGSREFNEAQKVLKGLGRFKKAQEGSRRLNKAKEG